MFAAVLVVIAVRVVDVVVDAVVIFDICSAVIVVDVVVDAVVLVVLVVLVVAMHSLECMNA